MIGPRSLNSLPAAAFVFFFLLVTAIGLFSIQRLNKFNGSSAEIRDVWLPNTRILGDLNNFTSDFRAAEGRYLLSSNAREIADNLKELDEIDRSIIEAQHRFEDLHHSVMGSDLYGKFQSSWTSYRRTVNHVLQLYQSGAVSEATDLYRTTSQAAFDDVSDILDHLTQLNVENATAASNEADAIYRLSRNLIVMAMTVAASLAVIGLVYLRRSVSEPLLKLANCMRRLARNDTEIVIQGINRSDEIGEMARSLVVFRSNAVELLSRQRTLSQETIDLGARLAQEQRLTQLQNDFISMASHEFRTPLTIIDGQAQRLIKLADKRPASELIERAKRIRGAVLRITTVIETLLSSSSVMDGNVSLHRVEIDLRTLLDDVCQIYREIAPQARILQNLGSTPLPVLGDRKLLPQMFGNLLSNALKYSPSDSAIDVSAVVEDDMVAVKVRDEGIGIPSQDLANVFDRFIRGSNVSGIVGTGVGLYLVRLVVELHHGRIAVESIEGNGSCFTIFLPRLPHSSSNEVIYYSP